MKYKKFRGIILKKQNYREADQIVTVWSYEAGKVRILAKALRMPKSRLNYACQDLSEVEIDVVGSVLPTLIGIKPLKKFNNLQLDLKKTATAFYAAELMLKMTADEHPNPVVYNMLRDFLAMLDSEANFKDHDVLDMFSLDLAKSLGFGAPVKKNTHKDVREFIEDILERNIKSEPFLMQL